MNASRTTAAERSDARSKLIDAAHMLVRHKGYAATAADAICAAAGVTTRAYREALSVDIEAAIAQHGSGDGVTAIGLASHIQAVLQGPFIVAKAANDGELARNTVMHLKRYVAMHFGRGESICPT